MLLLVVSGSQNVCADVSVYRYDGKLPFIRMMLGMMDAMGVIDKLPANGAYGGNPYSRYSSSPFSRSPWSQSPLTQTGQDGTSGVSPIWGSPDWGVLPIDRYTRNYNNQYGNNYLPHWSQSDMDGWVVEPWETSGWNSRAGAGMQGQSTNAPSAQQRRPQASPPQRGNAPLVQNFNFGVPGDSSPDRRPESLSPLAKLAQPQQAIGPPVRPPSNQQSNQARSQARNQARSQALKQSPLAKKNYKNLSKKPCVTEFCGLKKPNLNGLWVSQTGEMLAINNHRYLWSDGNARYLTGQIKVQNEYLVANVDEHEQIMRFKYKLAGNQLLTMQPDGAIREFARMSRDQYQRLNSGANSAGSDQGYGQKYNQNYDKSRSRYY